MKPVDIGHAGRFYREALAIAFCQPNVSMFMFFHAIDEGNLDRWQSGVYFVDGSAKSSLADVEDATRDTRGGVIAKCQGLSLTPRERSYFRRAHA